MTDLLIPNCQILQVEDERTRILNGHDILLRGNRISAIEPSGIIPPSHAKRVHDAKGQAALPGFINTHAHAPMVLWRGLGEDVNIDSWFNDYIWQLEANMTPDDVYWGMQLGLLEMIEAGVTAVSDHYWYMDYAARAVGKSSCATGSIKHSTKTKSWRISVRAWDVCAGGTRTRGFRLIIPESRRF